jgi:hypothetical protein
VNGDVVAGVVGGVVVAAIPLIGDRIDARRYRVPPENYPPDGRRFLEPPTKPRRTDRPHP